MNYALLADFTTALHAILIIGVFVGIAFSLRYKWFRPIEALVLLTAVVIWSLYGGCPLTYLEDHLRTLAMQPIPLTEVGFIPYYLRKWFGLSLTDQEIIRGTYAIAGLFLFLTIDWFYEFAKRILHKSRTVVRRG